jgi:ferredoxin
MTETHTLSVRLGDETRTLTVEHQANLRQALLKAGINPYGPLNRRVNCGGRGLCATCGVVILSDRPTPAHWHDALADRFRYPRLSCQIAVESDMDIAILTDKWVWGKRGP